MLKEQNHNKSFTHYENNENNDEITDKRIKMRQLGIEEDEFIFLPSDEAIKLAIFTYYREILRKKKRCLFSVQLRFEELYNFLFFFRHKDLSVENSNYKSKLTDLKNEYESIKNKRIMRKAHLKEINVLSSNNASSNEINRLNSQILEFETTLTTVRNKISQSIIILESYKKQIEQDDNRMKDIKNSITELN
jgi:hypothetical protein